ncbi:hypothetical protein C0585_01000 [Candidatus Woesearchaeota archaeon]|uniref:hypothetical protein n=1 Tax=uncultured Arcobacter sp. TaxID=165434 RepID=UPI000CB70396|nr:hypothetical protein [uncultured Arcobacter sp.]PLW80761.1 MAG: hypothetical protein C0585_01000 [Candidatus Woesearchaeota archaeon]
MEESLRGNKRGSISDVAFWIIMIIAFSVLVLIMSYAFTQVNDQLKTSPIGANNESAAALDYETSVIGYFDGLFLAVFIALSLAVLITAYFIYSNPIFVPVYIIALGFLVLISTVGQYIYNSLINNPDLASTGTSNPMMTLIMSHLIISSIVIGVLSMILIFSKKSGESVGGSF